MSEGSLEHGTDRPSGTLEEAINMLSGDPLSWDRWTVRGPLKMVLIYCHETLEDCTNMLSGDP